MRGLLENAPSLFSSEKEGYRSGVVRVPSLNTIQVSGVLVHEQWECTVGEDTWVPKENYVGASGWSFTKRVNVILARLTPSLGS